MENSMETRRPFGLSLSGFVLKIMACVAMVIDHVGAYWLTDVVVLRIIGRLAFPIFAFFIAEGCRYTRHKPKRFLLVFGLAAICEAGYYVLSRQITGTVLLTFSCSILIIYAWQALKKAIVQKTARAIFLSLLALIGTLGLGLLTSRYIPIDYGFPGVLLPVLLSLFDYREGEAPEFCRYLDRHSVRMMLLALGILMVWYFRGRSDVQFCALLALIPMMFYNGRPGRMARRFKYWFYVFYPAHLGLIWVLKEAFERIP